MKHKDTYYCKHCGAKVERGDMKGKKWYKSYCTETGKDVRMMLVKPNKK